MDYKGICKIPKVMQDLIREKILRIGNRKDVWDYYSFSVELESDTKEKAYLNFSFHKVKSFKSRAEGGGYEEFWVTEISVDYKEIYEELGQKNMIPEGVWNITLGKDHFQIFFVPVLEEYSFESGYFLEEKRKMEQGIMCQDREKMLLIVDGWNHGQIAGFLGEKRRYEEQYAKDSPVLKFHRNGKMKKRSEKKLWKWREKYGFEERNCCMNFGKFLIGNELGSTYCSCDEIPIRTDDYLSDMYQSVVLKVCEAEERYQF